VVSEGQPAPEFELATDEGERVSLASFRGRPVVLYFYPRADPGARSLVLGVSPDDEASHVRFKKKYRLPFVLVADPELEAAEAYDVASSASGTGSARAASNARPS
jgi:peroxiredoxin Q/BCP